MAYHIKKDGTPGVCKAQPGNCPLGGAEGHFDTIEEAQEHADKLMEANYSLLGKDTIQMSIKEFQEHALELDNDELKQELTIMQDGKSTLKGVNRIRASRKVEIIEAALKGENLLDKEKEEKEALQRKHNAELELADSNAKKMSSYETLRMPKSFERYVIDKPWPRAKVKAYRGELDIDERVEGGNSGMALYGSGVYSTTDKSYAEKYGKVRDAELEELPTKPLWVNTVMDFNQLEYELAKEYDTTKTAINFNMEIEDFVTKMGYDGVVVGTGKDMIIVNFDTERNSHLFK